MRLVLRRYATGSAVTGPDALIQDFYASECTNAVREPAPMNLCMHILSTENSGHP